MQGGRLRLLLVGIFSVLILTHMLLDLRQPLDCDEQQLMAYTQSRDTRWFNPLDPSAHMLSSVTARVSTAVLGLTPVGARLPGVLLSVAFLVLIALVSLRHLAWTTLVLLYLQLLANENVNWYFHSARSYAMVILVSSVLPALALRELYVSPPSRRAIGLRWGALFLLAALTNHLLLVFYLSTLVALIFAGYWNRDRWTEPQRTVFAGYRRVFLVVAPLGIGLLIASALSLRNRPTPFLASVTLARDGSLGGLLRSAFLGLQEAFHSFLAAFGGLSSLSHGALAALMVLLLVLVRRKLPANGPLGIFWTVLIANVVALGVLAVITRGWPIRYFVYLVPLFVVALSEAAVLVPRPALRYALIAAVFVAVVWVPFRQSHPVMTTNFCIDPQLGAANFVLSARRRLFGLGQ